MPKGLQVALTGAVGQVHKFLDDGSILIGSGSSAQGVTNKSATFFETARTGSATFYGNISASAEISASAYWGDGSNLTGINSVDVTDSTANTAFPVVFHNESTTGLHDDTGAFTYNPSTGEAVITKVTTPTIDVSSAGAMNIGATVGANNLTLGASNSTVVVAGNLTVNGTTTTVNSTTLTFDDKNIELAHSPSGAEGDDSAVDGGGITLKSSDSDKTLNWVNSTDSWTSSEHLDIASGKSYKINGTSVLNATTLGSAVVASSLTSVGTIATGVWNGTAIATAYIADDAVTPAKMSIFDDSLAATDTHIMIADGTDYSSFAMSGDATLSNAGVLTIAASAVHHSMLNDDIISGQAELAHADIADADDMMISDATDGVVKKVGVDSLRDHFFGVVSGDATVADGGALTIANDAIETAMLNDNVISGQTALGGASAAQADELLFSDGGTLKKITFSNLEDSIFGNVSGDATIAAGGALTIANTSVENAMLAGSITANKMNNAIFEDLESLGAAGSDGQVIVATGAGAFAYESGATLRTSIGIGTGDTVQVTNLTASTHLSASTVYAHNFSVANLSGAVDGNLVLASDADIVYKIDCDGDGTNNYTFQTGETSIAEMDESGNLQLSGGLSASLGVSASALWLDSTQVTSTAAELNIMDGGTSATGTTLADADRVVVNDNGTMVQVALTDFETYFESALDTLSNVTTVGALNAGSITSGFGAIDNGTSNITTGGQLSIDVDSGATINSSGGGIGAAGSLTLGTGADAGLYVSSDNLYIENKTSDKDIIFRGNDGGTFTTIATVDASEGTFKIESAGKFDYAGTLVTATGAELNYLDITTLGSSEASKALTADANGDVTVVGASANMVWDKSADLLTVPNLTVNGTTTTISTTNLAVSDNNITIRNGAAAADGSGITIGTSGTPVTLQMSDSAANLASSVPLKASAFIGALTGNADTATEATNVTAVANNSTDETVYLTFVDGATGTQGIETDTGLNYNPSSGLLTTTSLAGTLTTAAQTNITSLGTLTALTVDDVNLNGKVMTMTGDTGDTAVFTVGSNGDLSIVTTDTAAAAANIQITADGTVDIDSAGALTLDSGAGINLEPAAGSAILLDGTISVDAGVVTGATSITSTAFVGTLSTAAQTNITSLGTLTALVVDNVEINGTTIGHTGDTDILTLAAQTATFANDVDVNIGKTSGLQLGGVAVTSTAAELNLLDTATAGSIVNSKAVVYGSAGEVGIKQAHFTALDGDNATDQAVMATIAGDTTTHAGKFFYVTNAYSGANAAAVAAFSEDDKFYFVEKGGVFPSPFLAS